MTYKKIAQMANVSMSTVSKALSGSKEVSEELAQKIIKIAIEQGYFKEKGNRRLGYAKDGELTIAIICPEIVSVAYAREVTAIKNKIEATGGMAAVYVYDFDNEKLNDIIKMITVRNYANGIILFPLGGSVKVSSVPIVGITDRASSEYDTVCCDCCSYFSDIVGHLKNMGHQKIAFVGEEYTMTKHDAYKKALETHSIPYDEGEVYIIKERFERIGYEAAEKMMQKGELPTAVVCAYDEIALAMIHSFSENGIEVPKCINVVGINDIPMAAYSQVPLTTVRTYREEQGVIAINLLCDKIFNKSKVVQHITIDHELIERKSTSAAPRREE